jgi:hypothetical protein
MAHKHSVEVYFPFKTSMERSGNANQTSFLYFHSNGTTKLAKTSATHHVLKNPHSLSYNSQAPDNQNNI